MLWACFKLSRLHAPPALAAVHTSSVSSLPLTIAQTPSKACFKCHLLPESSLISQQVISFSFEASRIMFFFQSWPCLVLSLFYPFSISYTLQMFNKPLWNWQYLKAVFLKKKRLHRIKVKSWRKGSVHLPETKGKTASSWGSQASAHPRLRQDSCTASHWFVYPRWLCSTHAPDGEFQTCCFCGREGDRIAGWIPGI